MTDTTHITFTRPDGLERHTDVISLSEELEILRFLDSRTDWSTPSGGPKGRRVLQFGHIYGYSSRTAGSSQGDAPPIPYMFDSLCERLSYFFDGRRPTQCIVNEYLRWQGISAHTDSKTFGETIVTVSLGDEAVMIFTRDGEDDVSVDLVPRSAVIMSGESRYLWKHYIPNKVNYVYAGEKRRRDLNWRRISLTFRLLANE